LRFLLGVAEAGFFPGIIYYLGEWFPSPQKARAISRFIIATPLASAFGNPIGGVILGLNGRLGLAGWRWLFLIEGIPSVLLGISVLMVLTDRVDDARWLSGEQRDWLTARLRLDHDGAETPGGSAVLRALALPFVWLAALTYFLWATANYGYIYWAPTVVRDALHTSSAATGFITGVFAFLGAAGMLAVGRSSDRTGERRVHAAACAILIALGFVGAALLPDAIARVAALGAASVAIVSYLPPFWCLPAARLRGAAAAAQIALINSVGNAGGFVGPSIIGWVKDATGGTTVSFLVLAAGALVAASLLLVLRPQVTVAHSTGRGPDLPVELRGSSPMSIS
jgi:MFS transporter, ACS family, tartrate transporter